MTTPSPVPYTTAAIPSWTVYCPGFLICIFFPSAGRPALCLLFLWSEAVSAVGAVGATGAIVAVGATATTGATAATGAIVAAEAISAMGAVGAAETTRAPGAAEAISATGAVGATDTTGAAGATAAIPGAFIAPVLHLEIGICRSKLRRDAVELFVFTSQEV